MRRAAPLLLLAALLLTWAWMLTPQFDSSRPLVSLALVTLFCSGFGLLMAGASLAARPETGP